MDHGFFMKKTGMQEKMKWHGHDLVRAVSRLPTFLIKSSPLFRGLRSVTALCLCASVVFFGSFAAHAQNYAIDWFNISGGGGTSTGSVYSVTGTIGQPDTGISSGGNYTLEGGFWSIIATIQTPGAPFLKVKRAGNTVEISWASANTSGFLLEETGSAAGTIIWASVSASVTVVNNENVVTVPANPDLHFYRLRKP